MKRSRFSEEQIIAMLKEQEAGVATVDVCCNHGVSSATFYKWKAKYGGLDVSDARRLKALEGENAKLKRLLAEQMLERALSATGPRTMASAMLRDVTAKKW
jgi:putative transposase